MDVTIEEGGAIRGKLLAQEDNGAAGLAALVDELAHGVLVVGLDGRLLHANPAARQELSRGRPLAASERMLRLSDEGDARLLQDALARAKEGKRSLITLGSGDAPLTLAILPQRGDADSVQSATLMFARHTVCDSLMLCFFARNHGLTPAEEQVLELLCQGFSAPEAARQLKVAVSTARSHIRSLCAKTRSNSVRELVSRLAVLPPVLPAFRPEPLH